VKRISGLGKNGFTPFFSSFPGWMEYGAPSGGHIFFFSVYLPFYLRKEIRSTPGPPVQQFARGTFPGPTRLFSTKGRVLSLYGQPRNPFSSSKGLKPFGGLSPEGSVFFRALSFFTFFFLHLFPRPPPATRKRLLYSVPVR